MKLVYDALTGKVTQEPDDEREQAPQEPERKVTLKERIEALRNGSKEKETGDETAASGGE